MTSNKDDIRPLGTVEAKCSSCEWHFWLEALDPRLPDGPFICPQCSGNDSGEKAE